MTPVSPDKLLSRARLDQVGAEVARPAYVVFPRTTEEVVAVVQLANRHETPIVGRGAGTLGSFARYRSLVIVIVGSPTRQFDLPNSKNAWLRNAPDPSLATQFGSVE